MAQLRATVRFNSTAIRNRHMEVLKELVDEIAETAKEEFEKALSNTGSGRASKDGHAASLPGQPPAQDTGELKRSIVIVRNGQFERVVYSTSKYGYLLDRGTRYIRPRPWFRSTKEKIKRMVPQIVQKYRKRFKVRAY